MLNTFNLKKEIVDKKKKNGNFESPFHTMLNTGQTDHVPFYLFCIETKFLLNNNSFFRSFIGYKNTSEIIKFRLQ